MQKQSKCELLLTLMWKTLRLIFTFFAHCCPLILIFSWCSINRLQNNNQSSIKCIITSRIMWTRNCICVSKTSCINWKRPRLDSSHWHAVKQQYKEQHPSSTSRVLSSPLKFMVALNTYTSTHITKWGCHKDFFPLWMWFLLDKLVEAVLFKTCNVHLNQGNKHYLFIEALVKFPVFTIIQSKNSPSISK